MLFEHPPAPPSIALRDLTRRFPARRGQRSAGDILHGPVSEIAHGPVSEIVAVDRMRLDIESGELLGLLGPNGAGKTTALLMLSTLLRPSDGTALIEGFDIRTEASEVRRRIGVVLTGARGLYERLTGRENLRYFGSLYEVPRGEADARAAALLGMVGLADRADDLVGRYSTGMRVRLELAKALMHDPPVLLLDEPTLGLDPHGSLLVRDLIAALNREGKTVVLATHDMVEADRLSHRVAIVDQGRIVAVDPPESLKAQVGATDGEAVTLEDVFLRLTRRPLSTEA